MLPKFQKSCFFDLFVEKNANSVQNFHSLLQNDQMWNFSNPLHRSALNLKTAISAIFFLQFFFNFFSMTFDINPPPPPGANNLKEWFVQPEQQLVAAWPSMPSTHTLNPMQYSDALFGERVVTESAPSRRHGHMHDPPHVRPHWPHRSCQSRGSHMT